MATPTNTTWEIDPHTLAKHEILRRYLSAWFPILGKYNRRVTYIDGFCGPGRYTKGEEGSPIIALNEALKHGSRLSTNTLSFLFMDERVDRIEHLEGELSKLSLPKNFKTYPIAGQFATEFKYILDGIKSRGRQLDPTFAFIDPFGFKGLPFDLVRRLLKNQKTEVFINVMIDSINRFLEHPDFKTKQHIIDLFGTPKVLDIANSGDSRTSVLRLLYQEQLQTVAKFVRFFEMRNVHNRVIYYLFFATNNSLGHRKMKEAFWKIDNSSGFSFSDATNPNQLVLFEIDETPKLANELHAHFLHRRVSVEKIETFVDDKTAFIAKHMRDALKLLERDKKIRVDVYKLNGSKRRKNTFPTDAVVQFDSTLF